MQPAPVVPPGACCSGTSNQVFAGQVLENEAFMGMLRARETEATEADTNKGTEIEYRETANGTV